MWKILKINHFMIYDFQKKKLKIYIYFAFQIVGLKQIKRQDYL